MKKGFILIVLFSISYLAGEHILPLAKSHLPEKPMSIVITGYKNKQWFHNALDSALNQNYENFRIIYIDDASPDGTADEVDAYLADHPRAEKVTFIKNKERCRKLKNIYNAYHSIDDWNIIVQLDGDDWLAHENVLQKINTIYSTNNVWLTYGQFKNFGLYCGRKNGAGYCKATPKCAITSTHFRKKAVFMYMHLRTFYAWLFKSIKLESLLAIDITNFKGNFYPYANDAAFMYPMLEMARHHFMFVPQVLYICNRTNPLCGFKKETRLQRRCHLEIKNCYNSYQPLLAPSKEKPANSHTTLLVFSTHNPTALAALLSDAKEKLHGITSACIVYEGDSNSYEKLKHQYQDIPFFNVDPTASDAFNEVANFLQNSSNSYVLLLNDRSQLNQDICINNCMQELEQTGAYAFLSNMTKEDTRKVTTKSTLPPAYQHIHDKICATKTYFCKNNVIHNCNASIYRTEMLLDVLDKPYSSVSEFQQAWHTTTVAKHTTVLFLQS